MLSLHDRLKPCEASISKTLTYEGGYTNDPRDPGGATNWGITIFDARLYWKHDASPADVKAMPKSVAIDIYRQKYWAKMGCDDRPSGVDFVEFDFGVNSGVAAPSATARPSTRRSSRRSPT
jgi:lysozyme family protein